jgi:hypothetical protein
MEIGEKRAFAKSTVPRSFRQPRLRKCVLCRERPRRPGRVTIDGLEVDIGGELYAALKRHRSKEERLTVWFDALCINQTDAAERTE